MADASLDRYEDTVGLSHIHDYLAHLGIEITEDNAWLYEQAFTHSSFTYEYKLSGLNNYERLEFLGDAVLKILISDYLFTRFPHYREGELTKIRAVIVSDVLLARFAYDLGFGALLIMGPSEAKNKGAEKTSNLACAFEAFLGALYLDGRMEFARTFLYNLMETAVTEIDLNKTKDNYKAVLQEYTQANGFGLPDYQTVREQGPAHNRTFVIAVAVGGEMMGEGQGKSKKEAQQHAAYQALVALGQLPTESRS